MLKNDYLRVVTATPRMHIGNPSKNALEILNIYNQVSDSCDVVVTPELSLTGYTCQDMFLNNKLINDIWGTNGIMQFLANNTKDKKAILIIGFPLRFKNNLYNCAGVLYDGKVLGIVPKTYIPNYNEFYEKRWFSSGANVKDCKFNGIPFGTDLLFDFDTFKMGIEICEDLWSPIPPSSYMSMHGAEVIFNLSASNEVIGKANYRKMLVLGHSVKNICGYVYCSAGRFESTSDIVFSGHNIIAENGRVKGETPLFSDISIMADISLINIRHDRMVNKTFSDSCNYDKSNTVRTIYVDKELVDKDDLLFEVSITPFIPKKNLHNRCEEIFEMQINGLIRRLEATQSKHVVIGVSGGLDSTLALMVAYKAIKKLGKDPSSIIAVTMPCFGTTKRTKNNALDLIKVLECDCREIDITESVKLHMKDIGLNKDDRSVAFENCQARERTQILMDIANKEGGFVLGTGDLSELVLGWCTYNGDHMSMYGVNNSIPKTLIRSLVSEIAYSMSNDPSLIFGNKIEEFDNVINDILETPISPELLPPNEDGTIAQKTEDSIGSYILQDFFIYYHFRFGMTPTQIFDLCKIAINQSDEYKFDLKEVVRVMKIFYKRLFTQQFKRNCMPDGVKVGTISVSPRGDLRLPSEIEYDDILFEIEQIEESLEEREMLLEEEVTKDEVVE